MRSWNRTGTFRRWLPALTLLALTACADSTAPEAEAPVPQQRAEVPHRAVYSMSPGSVAALAQESVSDAVAGPRWCTFSEEWFDPSSDFCRGRGEQPPYGSVTEEEEALLLMADGTRAAPFVWSAPPTRPNPFPEEGDFTVDVRLKVEQMAGYGTGLYLLEWDPADVVGESSPFRPPVLQIWADHQGLRAFLPGVEVHVQGLMDEHEYRLMYEDGAYTLFVDGEHAAGPVVTPLRPTAVWMGNPVFTYWGPGDWSDFRVSQLTVSTPGAEVLEVPVDVKPGGCPSPINTRAKGMLPVAIAGTAELDVTQIDGSTLRLEGVAPARYAIEDVTTAVEPYTDRTADDCSAAGPDGIADLTAKFSSADVAAALSDIANGESRTLTLTGTLFPEFGGTPITGEDVVVVRTR